MSKLFAIATAIAPTAPPAAVSATSDVLLQANLGDTTASSPVSPTAQGDGTRTISCAPQRVLQ